MYIRTSLSNANLFSILISIGFTFIIIYIMTISKTTNETICNPTSLLATTSRIIVIYYLTITIAFQYWEMKEWEERPWVRVPNFLEKRAEGEAEDLCW